MIFCAALNNHHLDADCPLVFSSAAFCVQVAGLPQNFCKSPGGEPMSTEKTFDHLDRSPIHLLHRASQCAGDIFQEEVGDDLTPRQFAILLTVAQNEGLSQTHLVERTGIDRSTLADVIRRMLRKGLLQRRRTREDARAYAVRLTEEGWRVLKAAEPHARRADERILSVLPNAERNRLLKALTEIVLSLEAA